MSTTNKLRLGPLPRTALTKVTFACPASLVADLDRYAALHAKAYGQPVDAVTLIPYMLETFMARDRAFRQKNTNPQPSPPADAAMEPKEKGAVAVSRDLNPT